MIEPLLPSDPETAGSYRLVGRLGAGGMGVVYLAEGADGSRVALKMLAGSHRMDRELRARLRREARSLTGIDTPHVVRVIEVETEAEVPYLVMAYVEGGPLDKAVPEGGFRSDEVQVFGAQLAAALAEVHGRGILHRDLKPHNVIIGPHGLTLVDFGIASLEEEGTTALTREGAFMGSLAWLAPEVIAGGSADERSDVFGLGLTLGFMALGRHPYGAGRPEAVMYRIIHEQPDLTGLDPALSAVLGSALAREPRDRPTAAQVAEALRPAGAGTLSPPDAEALRAPAHPAGAPSPRRRPRRWAAAAAALALAAVIIGSLAVLFLTSGGGDDAGESLPDATAASPSAPATPPTAATVTFQGGCPQFACVLRVWHQVGGYQEHEYAFTQPGDSVTFPLPPAGEGVVLSVFYMDYENVPVTAITVMRPDGVPVGQPVSRQEIDAMSGAYLCWVPGADGTGTTIVIDTYEDQYGVWPIAWSGTALPTTAKQTPTGDWSVLSEPDAPWEEWGPDLCA